MYSFNKLLKAKKRHFLILSAANIHSGLESLYLETENSQWHIAFKQSIHYPQYIKDFAVEALYNPEHTISLKELAKADHALTFFYKECALQILAQAPKANRSTDLVICNGLSAWKGFISEKQTPHYWNIRLGDAQALANSLGIPVLTDFVRQDILYGGAGNLTISHGDLAIAQKLGDIAVLINIGVASHMAVFDTAASKIVVNSDTGPGTWLADKAARQAGFDEGFDRDGATASSGTVDTKSLEALLADEWFRLPAPKTADTAVLNRLYEHASLAGLAPADKVATLTAFTALSLCSFYKKEYTLEKKPDSLWLSGGGTYNLALIDFIKAYFAPLPVRTIDEIGIPNTCRVPLALGLTVQAYLDRHGAPGGTLPPPEHFGSWAIPC